MKKSNFKYIVLIIAIILLAVSAYLISQTYSKYLSTAGAQGTFNIAKWNVLVNNTLITSGSDISNTLEPIFPGNDHIKEGIIAPTAEGYFDLDLQFVEVDVSFKYTINVDVSPESSVSDIVISGYSMDEGANIHPFTGPSEIEEIIPLTSTVTGRNIRVYIQWNDDVFTEAMDNAADTLATTNEANRALVDVSIAFTQITE